MLSLSGINRVLLGRRRLEGWMGRMILIRSLRLMLRCKVVMGTVMVWGTIRTATITVMETAMVTGTVGYDGTRSMNRRAIAESEMEERENERKLSDYYALLAKKHTDSAKKKKSKAKAHIDSDLEGYQLVIEDDEDEAQDGLGKSRQEDGAGDVEEDDFEEGDFEDVVEEKQGDAKNGGGGSDETQKTTAAVAAKPITIDAKPDNTAGETKQEQNGKPRGRQ